MGRPFSSALFMAKQEFIRFMRYQYAEARKLGYPTMATFARDIARGDIGVAPPTGDDPMMDEVGRFYFSLDGRDRTILADRFGSGEKTAGLPGRSGRARVRELLHQLHGHLTAISRK